MLVSLGGGGGWRGWCPHIGQDAAPCLSAQGLSLVACRVDCHAPTFFFLAIICICKFRYRGGSRAELLYIIEGGVLGVCV